MKKEKWMLREIERWQAEEIVSAETADILKKQYEPKKNLGFLIVLFSVIGTLFIGMGIILLGANNWWYALPIAVRTIIAFLPLIASQAILFYVFKSRMHSVAFREGAAILNMAAVFSSIALIGQIFHLPGDFTNYVLICGILSLPTMVVMNAVAPLIIYYWTVINGGLYIGDTWGLAVTIVLYAVGAAFAVYNFRSENGKSVYVSWITGIAGFILMMASSFSAGGDTFLVLFAYFALLLTVSPLWEKSGQPLKIIGTTGVLVLLAIATYQGVWTYGEKSNDITFIFLTSALTLAAVAFGVKNFINKKKYAFAAVTLLSLFIRFVWLSANLIEGPFDIIFMIMFNIIMFTTGVFFIWNGAKEVNLISANTGMVTVCTLIIMRFFDSEMSLVLRGVAFLILGIGFLLFNFYLIRIKKREKEEAV